MMTNKLLARLRAREAAYGVWLTVGSPILAEEAALLGFDWVLLDTQHGYWGREAMINAFQVIGHTQTSLVTRVAWNDPGLIGPILDAGSLSVVVPMVNSREEAERAVAAVRYPPKGMRSGGGSRIKLYGADYYEKANGEVMVAVMIETREAVAHAEEILSVPGVDCCFIGAGDLAFSMGVFPNLSAEHEAAIQKVLSVGRSNGVVMGFPCANVKDALKRAGQGFQLLTCGSDIGAFKEGMVRTLKELKEGTGPS